MGSCCGATKVWCKTIELFMVYYHCKVHGEEDLQILGVEIDTQVPPYVRVCKSRVLSPSKIGYVWQYLSVSCLNSQLTVMAQQLSVFAQRSTAKPRWKHSSLYKQVKYTFINTNRSNLIDLYKYNKVHLSSVLSMMNHHQSRPLLQ